MKAVNPTLILNSGISFLHPHEGDFERQNLFQKKRKGSEPKKDAIYFVSNRLKLNSPLHIRSINKIKAIYYQFSIAGEIRRNKSCVRTNKTIGVVL